MNEGTERSAFRARSVAATVMALLCAMPTAAGTVSQTAVFQYDDAGRLVRADFGGGSVLAYTYDAAGNRLTLTSSALPVPPLVETGKPADLQPQSATLVASVNPLGQATSVWFEWGSSASYGGATPPQAAGSGTATVNLASSLAGLAAASTYHVRAVAQSAGGTSYGGDVLVVTPSRPNAAPIANPDVLSVPFDRPVTFDPRVNDVDPDGDSLVITGVSSPLYGFTTWSGTSVTYSPVGGFLGEDRFAYGVSDGHGGVASATVTVTVSVGVELSQRVRLNSFLPGLQSDPGIAAGPGGALVGWNGFLNVNEVGVAFQRIGPAGPEGPNVPLAAARPTGWDVPWYSGPASFAVGRDGANNYVAVWLTYPAVAARGSHGPNQVAFSRISSAGETGVVLGVNAAGKLNGAPAVCADRDGAFVVVWGEADQLSSPGSSLSPSRLVGRRFDPGGAGGAQFVVADSWAGNRPAIGCAGNGHFAVAWLEYDPISSRLSTWARTGEGAGREVTLGSRVQASETAVVLADPEVGVLTDGRAVVTWVGSPAGPETPMMRILGRDGAPSGTEERVPRAPDWRRVHVAVSPEDNILFLWGGEGLFGEILSSDLTPRTDVFVAGRPSFYLPASATIATAFAGETLAVAYGEWSYSNDVDVYLERVQFRGLIGANPRPVSQFPPSASASAPVTTEVRAEFDSPLAGADASTFLVHGGASGYRKGAYSSQLATIAFRPERKFFPGEPVDVTLTTGLSTLVGRGLARPFQWSFRAVAAPAPATFRELGSVPLSRDASIAFADLDGDGDLDLVAASAQTLLLFFFNDGAGNFHLGASFSIAGLSSIAVADLDGDGDVDIVCGTWGRGLQIFLNDGSGRFNQVAGPVSTEPLNASSILAFDLDGDGDRDLVCGNRGGKNIVFANDGKGGFAERSKFGYEQLWGFLPMNTLALRYADLDGDGDLDLVESTEEGNNNPKPLMRPSHRVWLNDGTGRFVDGGVIPGTERGSPAVGDVDGDGFPDVVVVGVGQLFVCRNDGTGHFAVTSMALPALFGRVVELADVDGDGDLDVVALSQSGVVMILLNDGRGIFTPRPTFDTGVLVGAQEGALAVGDMDGDGDLDIAVADTGRLFVNAGQSVLSLSSSTYAGKESGGIQAVVTRSGDVSGRVDVRLALTSGTATQGEDFQGGELTVPFASGQRSATINLPVIDDRLAELTESFSIALERPSAGAILGTPSSAVVFIEDDDLPSIDAQDAVVEEPSSGSTTVLVPVTLSNPSASEITVRYATEDGTATAPADYASGSGLLTFPPGTTVANVAVLVASDGVAEPAETFRVVLSAPVNASVGHAATVTILDGDTCTADAYEPDNSPLSWPVASLRSIAPQHRNFCTDRRFQSGFIGGTWVPTPDWARLAVCSGRTYTVATTNLGELADTLLTIYKADLSTVVATDDNGGGGKASSITFTASETATYYVRVDQADGTWGPRRSYDLTVAGDQVCSTWATFYGGDFRLEGAKFVAEAFDGSLVVAGRATDNNLGGTTAVSAAGAANGDAFWVARISPSGSILWQKMIDVATDSLGALVAARDGRSYLFGTRTLPSSGGAPADRRIVALGLDAQGNTAWEQLVSPALSGFEEYVQAAVEDDFGRIAVLATANITTVPPRSLIGGDYVRLVQFQPWINLPAVAGGVIYAGDGAVAPGVPATSALLFGRGLAVDRDGGLIVSGSIIDGGYPAWASGAAKDAFVMKVGSDLFLSSIVWQRRFPSGGSVDTVVPMSSGGYLAVGGWSGGPVSVMRLDATGQFQWKRTYDGVSTEASTSAALETPDGGFLLAGEANDGTGYLDLDGVVAKCDSSGNVQWKRSYGGPGPSYLQPSVHANDWFHRVLRTADGGILLAGGTAKTDGTSQVAGENLWLVKLDGDGNTALPCQTGLAAGRPVTASSALAPPGPAVAAVIQRSSYYSPGTATATAVSLGASGAPFRSCFTGFTATPFCNVTVMCAGGAEEWRRGTTHRIVWARSGDQCGTTSAVDLVKDGVVYQTIASGVAVDLYDWTVPEAIAEGVYKLRVTSGAGSADSSGAVRILASPRVLTLLSPNTGIVTRQQTTPIRWGGSNLDPDASFFLFFRDGTAWTQLAGPLPAATTAFDWKVPSTLVGPTRIRVGSLSNGAWEALDESDADVAVVAPGTVLFDWGDAPPPYPVLAANDGARHAVGPLYFGTPEHSVDAEVDGQPSPHADADDRNGMNDETIVVNGPLVAGGTASVDFTVSQAGLVDAWVDFNGNGSWSDPGERIFDHLPVSVGPHHLAFRVPARPATRLSSFARIRLSSAGTNGPTGAAPDGEVEDHEVSFAPLADIRASITDGAVEVAAGSTGLVYRATVSNAGPSDAGDVAVASRFSAGLTVLSWSCAGAGGGACLTASGTGAPSLTANLPSGAAVTLVVNAAVAATARGPVTAVVTASLAASGVDPDVSNNTATDVDQVSVGTSVSIRIDDGVATAVPGQALVYGVTVRNDGPADVDGAVVTTRLPGSLINATWSCVATNGSSCSAVGTGPVSDRAYLAAGGRLAYSLTGTVDARATGSLAVAADVTLPTGTVDDPGDNTATDTDLLPELADVTLEVIDVPSTVDPGSRFAVRVAVTNGAATAIRGLGVQGAIPPEWADVRWRCAATALSRCSATGAGQVVDAIDLAPGGQATYTLVARAPGASGTAVARFGLTIPAGWNEGGSTADDSAVATVVTGSIGPLQLLGSTPAPGSRGARSVVTSSDGSHAYVAAHDTNTIMTFALRGEAATLAGSSSILGPSSLALAGASALYAATDQPAAVVGLLRLNSWLQPFQTVMGSIGAESGVDLLVSPDGRSVYLSERSAGSIVAYGTGAGGALTETARYVEGVGGVTGLRQVAAVALTPDGGHLYAAADDGVAIFRREASSGLLTETGTLHDSAATPGLAGGSGLAVSADGVFVYVAARAAGTLTAYRREPSTGTLTFVQRLVHGAAPDGLGGVAAVAASPFGGHVYALGAGDGSVGAYRLGSSGTLASSGSIVSSATVPGLASASSLNITPDGTRLLVAGSSDEAVAILAVNRDGDLRVSAEMSPASIAPGDRVTTTVTVRNVGLAAVRRAQVIDLAPAQLIDVTWLCSGTAGGACTGGGAGDIVDFIDLAPGASVVYTVVGTLTCAPSGTLVNEVDAVMPRSVYDTVVADNHASVFRSFVGSGSPPPAPTVTSNSPVCEGSSLQLTASYQAGATYSWSGPNMFASPEQNPTLGSVASAASGTYSVSVSVGGCRSASATTSVVVMPAPASPTIAAPSRVLAGVGGYVASISPVTGATYSWWITNGTISAGGATPTVTFTSGTTGLLTLSVTVTTAAGCTSAAGKATVTVLPVSLYTVTPCRLGDTRSITPPALPPGGTRTLNMSGGKCGIPATARALVLNVTVVSPQAAGYLTLFPGDRTRPVTSTINFGPGQVRANNAIVPIGADGSLSIFNGSVGTTDVVVDVTGFFQ